MFNLKRFTHYKHIRWLPKKFCNTSYTSVKITSCSFFFFFGLFWKMLRVLAGRLNSTFSRACAGDLQNGAVWCMLFKQQEVFLIFRDREGISDEYHKRLRYVQSVNSVNESGASWASQIADSEYSQAELVTCVFWPSYHRRCSNVLMNSFETTNRLQPESLKLNFQYQKEVPITLFMP